jgi:hypothetical protein
VRRFQLYWPSDPAIGASFIDRAERARFSAVMVTLDNRRQPFRPASMEVGYLPFTAGEGHGVYASDPTFRTRMPNAEDTLAVAREWERIFPTPGFGWDDLAAIRERTTLPLIVKGVLRADDARRCIAPLSGRYLSFTEREEIALLRARGCGVREIARQVGRSPSTNSRELRRNAATRGGGLEYRASTRSGTQTGVRGVRSPPSWP